MEQANQSEHCISIHALLAESDIISPHSAPDNGNFYPRSPCGERRLQLFLYYQDNNFYPRSPCGERLVHALKLANAMLFLSTLSLRRATVLALFSCGGVFISIHALLAESDIRQGATSRINGNFYPRSPCGERHANLRRHRSDNNFYPRSPCGERRLNLPSSPMDKNISIHALLAESDRSADCNCRNVRPISIHALLAESDHRTRR